MSPRIVPRDARLLTADELRGLVNVLNDHQESVNDTLDAQGLLDLWRDTEDAGYVTWEGWNEDERPLREGPSWDALVKRAKESASRKRQAAMIQAPTYEATVAASHVCGACAGRGTFPDPLDGSSTPCGLCNGTGKDVDLVPHEATRRIEMLRANVGASEPIDGVVEPTWARYCIVYGPRPIVIVAGEAKRLDSGRLTYPEAKEALIKHLLHLRDTLGSAAHVVVQSYDADRHVRIEPWGWRGPDHNPATCWCTAESRGE